MWIAAALSIALGVAPAAAIDWDGGGRTTEWTDAANWAGDVVPGTADTATIIGPPATITGQFVIPVQGLEVGQAAAGGQLTMTGGAAPATLEVFGTATVATEGQLQVGPGQADLFAQSFTNSGEVVIETDGEVRVSGVYLQSGGATTLAGGELTAANVRVLDGALAGHGNVNAPVRVGGSGRGGAVLDPGARGIGTLNIDGDLTLASNARFSIDIDAAAPRPQTDQVAVSGMATLGGTLDLNLSGGSLPPGQRLEILQADGFNPGSGFDDILGNETKDGAVIVVFDPPGGGKLTAGMTIYASETRGNMNGDDAGVDELDAHLFAWAIRDALTYNETFIDSLEPVPCHDAFPCGAAPEKMADMDGDGARTFADIPLFLAAIDENGGSAAAAMQEIVSVLGPAAAVPELHSMGLAITCAGLVALRRRRSGRR